MKINLIVIVISFLPALAPAKILLVSESEMPELSNQSAPFRGKINHPGYVGHTWVTYPHVENPASLGIDPMGRVFVAEAHRFNLGVPDLRSNRHMIQDDYKARKVEDRLKMYQKYQDKRPMSWYTDYPERLIMLEDKDGNMVADYRSLFSDQFRDALDGIGFSVLAERDAVYFTCIPALRKLRDLDGDGVADSHEKLVEGFGVRVSFTGHDLHGIIRGPDNRLYFTVGDRGFYVETEDGEIHQASGRGAVFRCDSDGSNFEVYAHGLRNPQEIAFDDYGNLFTFDNTGDIGDEARVVYVMDNSDSGWDMSHQSPHQYVRDLDWGDYHLKQSVWVGEKMYDLYNPKLPQWVFPPVAHAGNGPSGVTWLTGLSVPEDLRNSFLLTDYRGAATKCESWVIKLKPDGAGFKMDALESLIQGLAASDVELGFDGNLYFADYGGGWSANRNGTVQVLRPTDSEALRNGAETARMFKKGFSERSNIELSSLLESLDRRIRQEAQFALVANGKNALPILKEHLIAEKFKVSSLHAVWALGQLTRKGDRDASDLLLSALESPHAEIRANAARTLGDLGIFEARELLLSKLADRSSRVRSLSAIALGRISETGDQAVQDALFEAVAENTGTDFEVTLRHAYLSALDRICDPEILSSFTTSESLEQRMMAVLLLRRFEHEDLSLFLSDSDEQIQHEAIRAVYDTKALTSSAGSKLLDIGLKDLPFFLQARVVSAAHRCQSPSGAQLLIRVASDLSLNSEIRMFALRAIQNWMNPPQFDSVLGHFRPLQEPKFPISDASTELRLDYLQFLAEEKNGDLASLGTDVAEILGIVLDPDLLRKQGMETELSSVVRLACLVNLAKLEQEQDDDLFTFLLKDDSAEIRAFALKQCFDREMDGIEKIALKAVKKSSLPVAREAIRQLSQAKPKKVIGFWNNRDKGIRPELWLDLYTALKKSESSELQKLGTEFVQSHPTGIHSLSLHGGNPVAGQLVFNNQGACLQCHKINGEGGLQGPELSLVGDRLSNEKLLESLLYPSAEITPGYGLSSIALNSGSTLAGRLAAEEGDEVLVITPDGKNHQLARSEIQSISPPVSAMPPMGLTLPPEELRDLIAYLGSRTKAKKPGTKKSSEHGKK